jgi:predicted MFS family arabinose efflux permease
VPSFVSSELKGTAYGVYYLVIGTCSLIANLVFGVLWDQISVNAAFQYSLVMSSVAIIGLIAFMIVKPNL